MSAEQRLELIETKLAYQDDALQSLSDVLARQQSEIDSLRQAVRSLGRSLDQLRESGGASPADERPPHY